MGGVVAPVGAHPGRPAVELGQRALDSAVARLGQLDLYTVAGGDVEVAELLADEQVLELRVLLEIGLVAAVADEVERRDGDVDMAAVEELPHVPVEEREHERANVRPVHVGVGHDDDPVVAELRQVELVADPGADHLHERLDLGVREHLVDPVLLGVDDLAAQREDRLVRLVARLLRGAAGGVALDDEELGQLRVADLAIGELLRHPAAERALAPGQVARLARRHPRPGGGDRLRHDLLRVVRVLLEEHRQAGVDRRLDEPAYPRVAQLGLGLPLELRVLELHGDDGGESLAHVLALEVVLLLLQQPLVARVLVQRPRQRRVEAGEVGAALAGVDVVREREDRLRVLVVPLHRHLDVAAVV